MDTKLLATPLAGLVFGKSPYQVETAGAAEETGIWGHSRIRHDVGEESSSRASASPVRSGVTPRSGTRGSLPVFPWSAGRGPGSGRTVGGPCGATYLGSHTLS